MATAYWVLNGLRGTLALHVVLPDDDPVSVLDRLLQRVKGHGMQVSCLRLAEGFASVAVMEYLSQRGQAALSACPLRGTTGGTRALCQGRKSYATHCCKGHCDEDFTLCLLYATTSRYTEV